MAKKSFQYNLSNIDMKDLYTEMLWYDMDWPEVIVVDEIEDGSDMLWKEMENGNRLVYLKNSERMFEKLKMELDSPKAKVVQAFPFENHTLENEELMTWICCACEIADLLDIRCPQIIFVSSEHAEIACGEGVIFLPDKEPYGKLNVVKMFVCIAHELRHEWQYVNHPDWIEGYVHVESDEDMDAYLNHKTEIDAEAYACKLAEIVFDVAYFRGGDDGLMEKLISRAQEIEIDISEDDIEYLQGLFDIEEWNDECEDGDEGAEGEAATVMVSTMNEMDRYAELQRIKYAEDRDREIDYALKCCEAKLRVLGVEPDELRLQ